MAPVEPSPAEAPGVQSGAMSPSAGKGPAPVTGARVLLVEDTPTQAEYARAMLGSLGHEVRIVGTAGQALETVREWQPDAVLLDLDLPDYSGIELMRRLRAEGQEVDVIIITANASINTAVDVMREGAVDFLVKPYAKARLAVTLNNSLKRRALSAELRSVRAQLSRDRFFGFIGASAPMQAVYRTIEAVAASRASVFITGPSGTGKELAAEAVHKASPRRDRAFVALNCGAIPRDLLESEVFGHIKGAFTGATADRTGAAKLADGGTLFLDEIGEMPLEMQVKLLRFVQTGGFQPVGAARTEKVDVRFVCATNRDPMLEVEQGRFREDLFYRLYVVPLELPPLKDRGDDVLLIARQFLAQFSKEDGRRFRAIAPDAEAVLLRYDWPGNVRQLQNVMRNIVVLHDAEIVEVSMLPAPLLRGTRAAPAAMPAGEPPAAPSTPIADVPAAPLIEERVPEVRVHQEPLVTDPIPPALHPPEPYHQEPVPPEPVPPELGLAEPTPTAPIFEEPIMSALAQPRFEPESEPATSAPAGAPPAQAEIIPLAEAERRLILAALEATNHDVPRAAAMLEVNPSTIYRKLQVWRGGAGR